PLEEQRWRLEQAVAAMAEIGIGAGLAERVAEEGRAGKPVIVDLPFGAETPDVAVFLAVAKMHGVGRHREAPMARALPGVEVADPCHGARKLLVPTWRRSACGRLGARLGLRQAGAQQQKKGPQGPL